MRVTGACFPPSHFTGSLAGWVAGLSRHSLPIRFVHARYPFLARANPAVPESVSPFDVSSCRRNSPEETRIIQDFYAYRRAGSLWMSGRMESNHRLGGRLLAAHYRCATHAWVDGMGSPSTFTNFRSPSLPGKGPGVRSLS